MKLWIHLPSPRRRHQALSTAAALQVLLLAAVVGQGACTECGAGLTKCGQVCVDLTDDDDNCGACGVGCGTGRCEQGVCRITCQGGSTQCGDTCVDTKHDPTHCGDCAISCNPDALCVDGACMQKCFGGTVVCKDGRCVDTQVDPENCGGCDKACADQQICSLGKCICPNDTMFCDSACVHPASDPKHCGGCNVECNTLIGESCVNGACKVQCVGGASYCKGECVDFLNNPENCGSCNHACPLGLLCVGGICDVVCGGGTKECQPGQCVDVDNDPDHCGDCNQVCPAGQVCESKMCALDCVGGSAKCGNKCVNLTNDPTNCGACGVLCPVGQLCANSVCQLVCPVGTAKCGGTCVDKQVDPKNCGACMNTCGAGQVCAAGACVGQLPACGNLACGVGEAALFFAGNTLTPLLDPGTVSSSVVVGAPGMVTRVVVQLYVSHTFDGDLVMTLSSVGGPSVVLSNHRGGAGDHFAATVFDSLCATSIVVGAAPFAGKYAPEQLLQVFNGKQAAGTWTLQVADTIQTDTGTLVWWHLYMCVK